MCADRSCLDAAHVAVSSAAVFGGIAVEKLAPKTSARYADTIVVTRHRCEITNYRDEITGEVGVALMGPGRRNFYWPNRGITGGIRPHGFTMDYKGLTVKEPYQDCSPYQEANAGDTPVPCPERAHIPADLLNYGG